LKEAPPRGARFSILHRAMKKQIDNYMSSEGLTGVQLFVLCELHRLEESETREIIQRDLENASHVSHPTMTDILSRLEKKGYIICRRSEQDRRYKCVRSAEKAQGLSRRMKEADDFAFESLCEGLSEEQRAQLITATDVMVNNALKYIDGNV
jgi:DNA-binding MarR family transcriptional regulator